LVTDYISKLIERFDAWLSAERTNSFGDPPGYGLDADDPEWLAARRFNDKGQEIGPRHRNINDTTGWLK
jgi:hypothetical protein